MDLQKTNKVLSGVVGGLTEGRRHLIGRDRSWDKDVFRLHLGDRKQELIMALLQKRGIRGEPDKRDMTAMIYRMPALDAKKIPGIYKYRYSDKWQGFGPDSMEGIEYMVVSQGKGKYGHASKVKYRGWSRVESPYGGANVPVKGELRGLKKFDSDTISLAISDDIQDALDSYLDDHPELWDDDYEG